MVSKVLDIEAINRRLEDLAFSEKHLRQGREQTGELRWPFGDQVQLTLADVADLLARVEELEAERANRQDEPSIVGALVGSLRAAGYQVTEPGAAMERVVLPVDWMHTPFNPDAVASDMLGEDGPVHSSLAAAERAVDAAPFLTDAERADVIDEPRICPSCEKPLPPDGKCLSPYVDCRSATSDAESRPLKLQAHQFVRITDGHWAGRHAVATGEVNDVGAPCVTVVGKGISLGDTINVERVFVVNPDVDAPADPPTKAEAPAAKGRRAEPPKLVTEWAPDGRDFEGYAKDLGCDVARVQNLVTSFKDWAAKSEPEQKQARWGGTFKAWAKARLTNQA
jgi:hypothetical protein